MRGKKRKIAAVATAFFLVLAIGIAFCTIRQNRLNVKNNLVYRIGDTVNLNVGNFLNDTNADILKNARLYSSLLNDEEYSLDEDCNVVSKGKQYLDIGDYTVYIQYKEDVEQVNFSVIQ